MGARSGRGGDDPSAPRWDRAGRPVPLRCLLGRHQWALHPGPGGEEYVACVRCQKRPD